MLGKHYISLLEALVDWGLKSLSNLSKRANVTILARNKEKYKQINFKPFEKEYKC